jgi:hypothetical protein
MPLNAPCIFRSMQVKERERESAERQRRLRHTEKRQREGREDTETERVENTSHISCRFLCIAKLELDPVAMALHDWERQ